MVGDPVSLIRKAAGDLRNKQVLDVGCGTGALSRSLASLGARMVGLDPSRESLAATRRSTPQVGLVQGRAESLPFMDSAFDVVVFLNSLHHVPPDLMAASLREAARTTRPEGLTIVIEPLPEGTFFNALKEVEDETKVRNDAQAHVSEAIEAHLYDLVEIVYYDRRECYADADAFFERIIAADQSRAPFVQVHRVALVANFERVAGKQPDGSYVLDQPIRAHILRPVEFG
ncbi:class I SAM-dependent methyltransferase [Microvirga massiliensis]|uniref:class I SAM-dependent methyltransferase n=1 Tax=Microvirga massiliensis TaxID=1033741 RepID=UPI00062B9028|nr:class I SAM-dependent methyltransferase [Microvirga massiliensis]